VEFEAMTQYSYIGRSVPRLDSPDKVTGQAIYSSDIQLPRMLIGKCKRSPHPFARILSINVSKALKLPGIRAVITANNVNQSYFGGPILDQLPLCNKYAYYIGDEVAAVAAVDDDLAEEAIELIEVEYELLMPVFDQEKAIEPESPAVHPELKEIKQNIIRNIDFERGEGEAAFKKADIILEERFYTQPMHQCYLQTRDCVAAWHSDRLTLWAAMQAPFRTRAVIAKSINIPEHYIRIIPCYVGGGFGSNMARIWPITALLARNAGQPVKLALTREEEFIAGRPFASAIIKMRMGFKKDGTLVAKKMNMVIDAGAYTGASLGVLEVASGRADNLYRLPNIITSSKLVYTNNIPRGSLRGFGTQIITFALESMIDMAADELDIDPVEIRLKNASQKNDTTVHGFILNSCGFSDTLKFVTQESGWGKQGKLKQGSYGIGLASAIHVSGTRRLLPVFEGSSAIVHIDHMGKVLVISGELDIGQGAMTVFAQIAAEELGVDIDDVRVLPVDTDVSPFSKGTFGDRVTTLGGHAVLKAAADARKQLISYAAETMKISADKVEIRNGEFYISGSEKAKVTFADIAQQVIIGRSGLPIIGQGEYHTPAYVVEDGPKRQYYGNYSIAYTFITQVAEVYVDRQTGKVEVLNIYSFIDLGKAINPKACEGQVEGGVTMGLGYALSEDYALDKGRMLNPNFTDYKLSACSNTPEIRTIFIETIDPATPYGAKAIGEAVGDATAAVIANAIFNALGVRIKELPITPEKILKALKDKGKY